MKHFIIGSIIGGALAYAVCKLSDLPFFEEHKEFITGSGAIYGGLLYTSYSIMSEPIIVSGIISSIIGGILAYAIWTIVRAAPVNSGTEYCKKWNSDPNHKTRCWMFICQHCGTRTVEPKEYCPNEDCSY